MKNKSLGKRGAIELSVGTMIVIILGVTMLILGLVLIRNISEQGGDIVNLVNKGAKAEINKLFNNEDTRIVIYLSAGSVDVKKGKKYNVEFGIKNVVKGESEAGIFSYVVQASEVENGCKGLSLEKANKFIILGKQKSNIPILAGEEPKEFNINIEIPEDAPLCSVAYDIIVKKDGRVYDSSTFSLGIGA